MAIGSVAGISTLSAGCYREVDLNEKAEYWHEVYRRRAEWVGGYMVDDVKAHDGTMV